MDIKERIAGLLLYPAHLFSDSPDERHSAQFQSARAEWTLARLALALDLAQKQDIRLIRHEDKCSCYIGELDCDCGRDALLKALEVPRAG